MSVNPSVFSIIAIFSAAFVGLGIFLYCKKCFTSSMAPFFKNYIIGFIVLGLGFFFHLLINLGLDMKYPFYLVVFLSSQFAIIMAHSLFIRGTVMLDTKDKFKTTIFPLIVLPAAAVLTILGLVFAGVSSFTMFTIIRWGFMIPIKVFLAAIFLYYFFAGSTFDTVKSKFHTIFLGLIWLVSLGMDVYLWFMLVPAGDFWSLKLASFKGWYILRAAVYWFTLAAILVYAKYLKCFCKPTDTK